MSVRFFFVFSIFSFFKKTLFFQGISKMVFVFMEKLAFLHMVLKNCGFHWLI